MSKSIALYLHIPFCSKICPYCGFYKLLWEKSLEQDFVEALCREIDFYAQRFGELQIDTVFFGGGTPNLLRLSAVERIMALIYDRFDVLPNAEITMEMNPGLGVMEKLRGLKQAGINRVSLGVQSLDDSCLTFLGRNHTADVSRRTLGRLRDVGFDNVSVDVMFALPGFDDDVLVRTIKELRTFEPQHVSAYSLSIEPGTPFKRNRVKKASVHQDAEQFDVLRDELEAGGFIHYEVSNYALPGFESRHNTYYWMGASFIGMGPGAHSYFNGGRYHHARDLAKYVENPVPRAFRQKTFPVLNAEDEWVDYVMLRLRLVSGVTYGEVLERFGVATCTAFKTRCTELAAQGFMIVDDRGVRVSRTGILVLDEIVLSLV
ncbi:MAG: radical SAM family heme chaperone HemW [bacterium]|nr:radical SAM family heme chaperone HemW [bacterium]